MSALSAGNVKLKHLCSTECFFQEWCLDYASEQNRLLIVADFTSIFNFGIEDMDKRRVVITGIGIISPLANTRDETWAAIKEGKSGIGAITQFDASQFNARIAAEVKNFNPEDYVDSKEVKKYDLFSHYAIAAAKEAREDAAYAETTYTPERSGCILGVGLGGLPVLEKYHRICIESGPRRISPFLIPALISNLAAGNVAVKHNLRGTSYIVTSACASSTHAIGEAYRMIADNLQDIVFTGGAESTITEMAVGGFCSCKALSTRNDEPEKASRPFDRDRDGFVIGEGGAILILEEYEAAKKRGAKIYAEVVGYGFSCDAYHITAPHPDGIGAINSMKMALDWAKLNPEQVGYINAHGTSTGANDVMETKAIKEVFGDYAKHGLMVSSTKSMVGHLLGAAGGIEAAFSALAITDGVIPPTINLDHPDDECDLDYVPNVAREAKVKYVMSNSFGFGGANGTIILGAVE